VLHGGRVVTVSRKVISLIAIAVMALSSLSLVSGMISPPDEPVVVSTDKDAYVAGESAQINVTVVGPFTATFNSTCMVFFVVEDASNNSIYDLRLHAYWLDVLTGLRVPPGATKVFKFTLNQKDDASNQVQPGSYKIWGYVAGYNPMDAPRAGGSKLISIGEESVFEVALVAGWNLVSIPLVDHGYRASTLPLKRLDVVVRWDSANQTYDRIYIFGVSPPPVDFAIEGSTGYWIYTSAAETLHLYGNVPTTIQTRTITVPAGGGWAFIGFCSFKIWHASDIPRMYSGRITLVACFDPVAKAWRTFVPGVPPSDFSIVPGQGCLIMCTSGTLSYMP